MPVRPAATKYLSRRDLLSVVHRDGYAVVRAPRRRHDASQPKDDALRFERVYDGLHGERLDDDRLFQRQALQHGDLRRTQRFQRLRHLEAHDACTDDDDALRHALRRGYLAAGPWSGLGETLDGRDERQGARREHDGLPRLHLDRCAVFLLDDDAPGAVDPAPTSHERRAYGVDPRGLTTIVPMAGERIAGMQRPRDVHGAGYGVPGGGNPPGGGQRLGGPQHRLAGHARPVRALAADQLRLHDRGAESRGRGASGHVLSGSAAADDNHVIDISHGVHLLGLSRGFPNTNVCHDTPPAGAAHVLDAAQTGRGSTSRMR